MNQTAKPAPLGRGLSALFGDADTSYQTKSAVIMPPPEKRGALHVAIGFVKPGAFQPRRNFDDASLKELAESVRERGIMQPIIVRSIKGSEGRYEIVAGERRWRAAQLANLHEVPVIVRECSDSAALEFGILENVQREDLSPLEEAEGYQRLMDDFQHTQESLSKILGKSRPHIANLVRLLALPESVRKLLDEGKLSAGHARLLVNTKNPEALAERIVREGLNVRQAEILARQDGATQREKQQKAARDADTLQLEKELARATGFKISIASKGKAGSVTIKYQSLEQLDAVIAKLKG